MPRGSHMKSPEHRARMAQTMRDHKKTRTHRAALSKTMGGSGELPPRNKFAKLFEVYRKHRSNAQVRGITWDPNFTFELWFEKWDSSGKLEQRGVRANQYVMARKGDVGPYSFDNTEIKTCTENHQARKASASPPPISSKNRN